MRLQSWLPLGSVLLAAGLFSGCFGFSADPTTGTAPLEVDFRDNSWVIGAPDRKWHFGDQHVTTSNNTSTELAPVHVYEHPGTYTVTLRVSTLDGLIRTDLRKFIEVLPPPDPPAEEGEGENGEGEDAGETVEE